MVVGDSGQLKRFSDAVQAVFSTETEELEKETVLVFTFKLEGIVILV